MVSHSAVFASVPGPEDVSYERSWQVVDGKLRASWRPAQAVSWRAIRDLLRPTPTLSLVNGR